MVNEASPLITSDEIQPPNYSDVMHGQPPPYAMATQPVSVVGLNDNSYRIDGDENSDDYVLNGKCSQCFRKFWRSQNSNDSDGCCITIFCCMPIIVYEILGLNQCFAKFQRLPNSF
ncbi:hypothetical protein D5018_11760 [Parashewanella curva]|uniref:Uncharacterized protein n=1 Tax=Parashewanella curva TaxID=2338552 RepID=A0A3L8PXL3_9GAMM|nr:hypothetical protein [Parashewanella curva]RLV59539.1 hypothetical protein D5018_11760 [Parashewanella curva]